MTYWVAGAAIGGAVIGGAVQSSAASKAAKAQTQAAELANETQMAQYNQTREDQAPFMERGNQAGNRLQYLLGLSPTPAGSAKMPSRDELRAQFLPQFTSKGGMQQVDGWEIPDNGAGDSQWTRTTGMAPGAEVIDEVGLNAAIDQHLQQQAQQQAQQQQAAQSDPAYGSLSRSFSAQDMNADPIYSQLAPGIQSSIQRSTNDLNQRGDFANSLLHQFGAADFQKDPGYDFRMREGQKSVENSAAARGMQLSGATLKAMQRFGQDFASNEYGKASDRFSADRSFAANEYGNAFNRLSADRSFGADQMNSSYNRFNTNTTNQYNRLAGVAGTGQQSNALVAGLGANMANQVSQNQLGVGNAQAASGIAGANAVSGAIGQGYNMYQGQQLMNSLGNRGASGTGGSSTLPSGSYQWNGGAVQDWENY